jgi:hypothetical protein
LSRRNRSPDFELGAGGGRRHGRGASAQATAAEGAAASAGAGAAPPLVAVDGGAAPAGIPLDDEVMAAIVEAGERVQLHSARINRH